MSDPTFRDTENKTASIAVETSSYRRQLKTTSNLQLQQQCGNSLARDLDSPELASTGREEENISLENMLALCPDVPLIPIQLPSIDEQNDSATCTTANVMSMSSVPCPAPAGPTLCEDTDKPAKVQLLWPLEVGCDHTIKISQILQSQS